jgi:thioester reductase-like protein
LQPADRVLQLSSISFDASVFEIVLAFSAGATLCLGPPGGLPVGVTMLELMQRQRISCVTIVPSLLQVLPPARLPELTTIICAGEACTAELVDRWAMDGRRFFNAYGPTETTIWATIAQCQPGQGKPTIGKPIGNTYARVLDEKLRPVPAGTAGELCLGGVHLARGYFRAPELTASRFVADPLAPAERLYRTGDLARLRPDGQLDCLGRTDRQIKLRGYRIEPSEIEEALQAHPAVRQALVLAWSHNGCRRTLTAYVVPRPGATLDPDALRAFLAGRLPAYMVPFHYVPLAAMPLSPSGKVDPAALPRPAIGTPVLDARREASLEARLAELFAAALGLEDVSWDSRFFDDLGGDSLAAVDLMTRIDTVLGLSLPLRVLFDHDTVNHLSAVIRAWQASPQAPPPVAPPTDWARELQLDPDLLTVVSQPAGPRILLTGATGFVGAFLLRELLRRTSARVSCLVRAPSAPRAFERLREALERFGLWSEIDAARLEAIPGEISQPELGLDRSRYESLSFAIDAVYHCAALVNFVYPYRRLKPVNVDGTKHLIRFASQGRRKQLHHISSLAVYGSVGYFGRKHIDEDELDHIDSLYMGYAESKAVSERLVRSAGDQGLPVKIYRLDDVIGHSDTGVWNTDDFLCRYIKGAIQLGMYPELDIRISAVPVDVVARVLCHLSLSPAVSGRCFNIFNPRSVSHGDLFGQFRARGHSLRPVPYHRWRQTLVRRLKRDRDNALATLVSLFTDTVSEHGLTIPEMYEESRRPVFSDRNTTAALAGSGIRIPPLDREIFDRYYGYFVATGFLSPP